MATVAAVLPRPKRRRRNQPVSGRASLPVFYSVKRNDNSRLRRQINLEQRREFLVLLGLSVAVFTFVFLFSWQHFQCVRYGYQIEQLKSKCADLEQRNHQLRLAEASLADPHRIDTLARRSGLTSPSPHQIYRMEVGGEEPVGGSELARNIPNLVPASAAILSGR